MTACQVLESLLPANVYAETNAIIEQYEIDTPLRISHFLAQCAHESNNFSVTVENLNYSADGLLRTFPTYFNNTTARQYARQPVKIASRVYANRMGNGNEASQDGWKYKGRGYIQLTGKENYSKFDAIVEDDIIAEPVLVATKYPLLSAAWFWNEKNLNDVADLGAAQVESVTRVVNGGTNGLVDRQTWFDRFYTALKPFESMVSTDKGLISLQDLEVRDIVTMEENARVVTTEWLSVGEVVRRDVNVNKLNIEI